MKILQVCNHFYPHKGGIEEVVLSSSRELSKRGHSVKVICADEPRKGNLMVDGIEVKRLKYIFKVSNTNITASLPVHLLMDDSDVIHTHLPYPWNASVSGWISLFKKKPLFLTYHNDITGRGINKFIAGFYNWSNLRFLLTRSEKIFIYHKNFLDSSEYLKLFQKKVVIIPPGMDFDRFKPLGISAKEQNTIFFMSILDKLHLYKGLEILLSSIKKIAGYIPLKLYVGGEGKLKNYYKDMVRENDLENIVEFLGYLDEKELVRQYNLCDIFVLPSVCPKQEGFGLVALEAMACRKPVIISKIVGAAEDVENYKAGIVVEPNDIDGLAGAIKYLLLNKDERHIMADNAYRLVREKYSWQKYSDILEQEYQRAL